LIYLLLLILLDVFRNFL